MSLLTWYRGRQSTEKYFYHVMKLFRIYKLDCYLIKYTKGCAIGYHRDVVEGHRHYRLNIQLRGKNRLCTLKKFQKVGCRIQLFRADEDHSFGLTLENGLILSFGIAIKEKRNDKVG